MASDSAKPNVLIFGGLNTYSRGLAAHLVPIEGEACVSHLRIVDKYSVFPPTTYIGPEFPKVLEKPEVEYRQANLTVETIVKQCFEPPEGQAAYDYVFDFTGEISYDRPDAIQINTTANVALMIGTEAAKRKVKAYVRLQLPFYDTGKKLATERDDVKPFDGPIGVWWHEALRMLGNIDDLNLVILRIGLGYGPYVVYGHVTTFMTVASVYGYLQTPMRMLWGPGKHYTNTVHIEDISGALWACAEWMAVKGRKDANDTAGEVIPFHNSKSKAKETLGVPPPDKNVVAPLFNLVDDSSYTLATLGQTLTSQFNAAFEFFGTIEAQLIKASNPIEEINDAHVSGWTEMIQRSNPPVTNTALVAYMDKYSLQKWTVGFDNTKIKNVLGYQLQRPQLEKATIAEIVNKWKEGGSWPVLD